MVCSRFGLFGRLIAGVGLACGVVAVGAASRATALTPVTTVEGIVEYRLPNGLQVLLAPDESKPTVTVNMTYHVGSRHENYGETGMAHLLEHLLFKGTPTTRNALAEFSRRGLRANGSTWLDRTNYFASFAYREDNLRWYLDWQADAMVHSFIARRDLDSEMTVVRNEMEMGENDPGRILLEKTQAAMYDWHNYGKSTIGARADVENVDIGRLQAFYRTYYQPDNATLIVAGKFDEAKVLGWIERSFGRIPKPRRKLPPLYTLDAVQDGERAVTLRRVGGAPIVMAAYHAPPGPHPDFAAIELLDLIANDAPAGRLHKRLVDGQLAAEVFGFVQALADPGFAMFGAQLAPGQDVDKARDALVKTMESLSEEPITAEELERAQATWLKGWEQAFSDPEQVGVALSETVSQGDWRLFFLQRDRVKQMQLDDVKRVAASYFVPANRTLATYLPTDKPVRAPAPERVDLAAQMKTFKPVATIAKAEAFDASPANIDARTQRFELASGLKAALLPKGTRGAAVQAVLTLRMGDERSLVGQEQVASMVAALIDKGSRTLTRQQVRDRLNALQSEIDVSGGADAVSVSITSRREFLPEVIALVGDLLREPAFAADTLEETRRQWLAGLESQRKEPGAVALNAVRQQGNVYPRGDIRHARNFDEVEADMRAVDLAQVRAFHARFYGASAAQFAAVGDFDVAAVRRALDAAFGHWKSLDGFTRVPQPLRSVPGTRMVLATPDKQNATLYAVQRLPINDAHPDYPALTVANWMLGASSDSRLWMRVREKEGLSYDVRSAVQWNNFEENSAWYASAIFAPGNRDKVETAMREEIARALQAGFGTAELVSAKSALLNFRRLGRAQDGNLAAALAGNLYLGRSFALAQKVDAAIEAVTLDQVNAALRKYLRPADFVTAVAGDFKD